MERSWRKQLLVERAFWSNAQLGAVTLTRYTSFLTLFLSFCTQHDLHTEEAEEVDDAMVRFFNEKFMEGTPPTMGEYVLASWMHFRPKFSRLGQFHLPRAWRALRGWKILSPHRSRRPQALPIWCAIAWRMVARGQRSMGVFVLTCLSSYCRPGELLKVRRCDWIAPVRRVLLTWSVILFPEEEGRSSKTGQYNDSILMDSSWLGFLNKDYEQMHDPRSTACSWPFTYQQFVKEWKAVVAELGLERLRLVPYQLRHSGPSNDMARSYRSLEEAKKRGRWSQSKSMQRYERRGRLGQDYQTLTPLQQQTFELAEKSLEAIFAGHHHAVKLPAAGWQNAASSSQTSSQAAKPSLPQRIVWAWQRGVGK